MVGGAAAQEEGRVEAPAQTSNIRIDETRVGCGRHPISGWSGGNACVECRRNILQMARNEMPSKRAPTTSEAITSISRGWQDRCARAHPGWGRVGGGWQTRLKKPGARRGNARPSVWMMLPMASAPRRTLRSDSNAGGVLHPCLEVDRFVCWCQGSVRVYRDLVPADIRSQLIGSRHLYRTFAAYSRGRTLSRFLTRYYVDSLTSS